ncbi:NAD-dependent epimerase/dehydratase family protein [Robinsoniella peoriensis]|uniref:NAD-dependent epimerase/dehydratase family protein n=1 Tax=Robinsoniella peoriensis TaxID=180332 RepID=UPI00085CC3BA|nr:NAD-dependent epimerase/dehydratase family protein [Robinsoniella peoriensis]
MENNTDQYVLQDINRIIEDELSIDQLRNKTILITGATGLIGTILIKGLLAYNRSRKANIRILALVRDLEKAEMIFEEIGSYKNLKFIVQNILEPFIVQESIDYIIHGASLTASKDFVCKPVETIDIAINGTKNILELARKKQIEGMVYLSSLEVYGIMHEMNRHIRESDCGHIDFLSVRSSYSEGKRMVECMCMSYLMEYNVPVKIARLAQTFGPGVSYDDGRVFAEFSRCAIEKRNIVLRTEGSTIRNYCYTSDAVRALLYILLKGNIGEAYNVANKKTSISIKDMAELVADKIENRLIDVEICIETDIEKFGYNPTTVACLAVTKLESLGWTAKVDLEDMFRNTIESMKISKEV